MNNNTVDTSSNNNLTIDQLNQLYMQEQLQKDQNSSNQVNSVASNSGSSSNSDNNAISDYRLQRLEDRV